jgi:hypothetical protein
MRGGWEMSRIDEIRKRCEAATPGPWTFEASEGDCGFSGKCPRSLIYCDDKCPACEHWEVYKGAWPNGPEMIECGDYAFFTDEDAALIAHARDDIPALLDEIARLTAERDAAYMDGVKKAIYEIMKEADVYGSNVIRKSGDADDGMCAQAAKLLTAERDEWRRRAEVAEAQINEIYQYALNVQESTANAEMFDAMWRIRAMSKKCGQEPGGEG